MAWTTLGRAGVVRRAHGKALISVKPSMKERARERWTWEEDQKEMTREVGGRDRDGCQRMSLSIPLFYLKSLRHYHFPGIIFSKIKMFLFYRLLLCRLFFFLTVFYWVGEKSILLKAVICYCSKWSFIVPKTQCLLDKAGPRVNYQAAGNLCQWTKTQNIIWLSWLMQSGWDVFAN